jgi:hypothetical protein
MNYDQYKPAKTGKNPHAQKNGASPVICLHSSRVAKNGLWVKKEQATAKKWWALQQLHISEFRSWIMINIDQLYHLEISWHSYMCLVSHFDSIDHQWQMIASGSSTNRNKQQQNSCRHCRKHILYL